MNDKARENPPGARPRDAVLPLRPGAAPAQESGQNGGEPPDSTDMNERIAVLEARIEALATKQDVAEVRGALERDIAEVRGALEKGMADLKADVHESMGNQLKWIVGTGLALGLAGITVLTFVLNNAIPKSPSTPAPLVIQIPAYGAPPAAGGTNAAPPATAHQP
jgi:hypothetical protein